MYKLFRRFLFLLPAEASHDLALFSLSVVNKLGILNLVQTKHQHTPVTVMGIEFPNKIGLAAGLDKNGKHINALSKFGFGFVEIGTVTPKGQPGNPKPRLFRIPKQRAIINRMGFNNHGIDNLIQNVNLAKDDGFDGVLGINIGKNLATSVEDAVSDYLIGLRQAYFYADYITVNISSPNTPGLRSLQYGKELDGLLSIIKAEQMTLSLEFKRYVPIAIKVAPDLTDEEVKDVAESLLANNMDCLIATNTTLDKKVVENLTHGKEAGGLSGEPVRDMSTRVIAEFQKYLKDQIPIIGVGGIASAADAKAKLEAGAALVQVYSGLIYEGPGLVKRILKEID
ncbi:MAG: quinone-dependent dihydroorotate dehydrogenase [Cocleimonas sp.]